MLAAVALLAACGGDVAPVSPPDAAAKVDVRIKKSDAVMLVRTPSAEPGARGGTTLQLDAEVLNPQGHVLPHKRHVYWTSTNPEIATVDSTGFVTALDTGEVDIIVDHKKGDDTLHVLILPVPVAAVTLVGADSLSVDDTAQFVATALDSIGEPLLGRPVAWSSIAPGVASVSATGEVVALGVGHTNVSATIGDKLAAVALQVWPEQVASVEVPALTVPQFRRVLPTAVVRDRRGKALAGRTITWTATAPAIADFRAGTDSVVGRDVGTASIVATVEGVTGAGDVTVTNPVEARALWITRFEYTTASAVDFTKIATIMQKAASANFNVVYFQVRTSGDALYYSDIEPCSPRMCGTLGGPRPSRDPLDVALTEAAKHGIQVHAWINAYTGFISGSSAACNQYVNSTPMNWLRANPSWSVSTKNFSTGVITRQVDNCLTSAEYMYVSPGVPGVRARVAQVSADIARRYGPKGLKGIHLDRIRYPSNQVSYDPATQEAFRSEMGAFPTSNAQASWLNFRRTLVNRGVKEVHDSLQLVDPSMVLSAAVFPGYKREGAMATWSAQWSHSDLFQDPQAWAEGGYLDVELPMNYPATATSTSWTVKPRYCDPLDWACVMDDHIRRIERTAGRQVYVGVGAIKGWDEVKRQLDLAHDRAATGVSVYSFSQVDAIPNGWAQLAAGPFKHKATVPAMAWKPAR